MGTLGAVCVPEPQSYHLDTGMCIPHEGLNLVHIRLSVFGLKLEGSHSKFTVMLMDVRGEMRR